MSLLADSAVAEVLSERRAAAGRARQDRPRHRAAVRASTCAGERSSREIKRQIPELERWVREHDLLELDPDEAADRARDAAAQARHRGRGHRRAGPLRSRRADLLQRDAARRLAAERAESWLREYNRWMLPILNIHEAVPGPLRAARLREPLAEPNQIHLRQRRDGRGLGRLCGTHDARVRLRRAPRRSWLIYSKWNLRSVCNTILDYAVHVLGMTEAEAIDLLDARRRSRPSKRHARNGGACSLRACSSRATSRATAAILDLREQLKRERGDAFDLKRFHEEFLSYGSAPVKVIRELMVGEG